jgi:hypothetical protein
MLAVLRQVTDCCLALATGEYRLPIGTDLYWTRLR